MREAPGNILLEYELTCSVKQPSRGGKGVQGQRPNNPSTAAINTHKTVWAIKP